MSESINKDIKNKHIDFINSYITSFLELEKRYSVLGSDYIIIRICMHRDEFLALIDKFALYSMERSQLPEGILSFIDKAFNLYSSNKLHIFKEEDFIVFIGKMKKIINNFEYYLPDKSEKHEL